MNYKKVKALGLSSGGLDSILAAKILQNQGIDVTWITFDTPFFPSDKAIRASKTAQIPIIVKEITYIYLEMLKNPSTGYGKNMNPCRDCHSLMFKLAGQVMQSKGFDFLFSGEVVGQRPMSQTKSSMAYVSKHSDFKDYIVRPLSAKLLPETIIEKKGLVNRDLLLDISGRSRKPQIKLAKELGLQEYPSPAGGCFLTDKVFSERLKDLFEHQKEYRINELNLLKYGRHFRLDQKTKIVVGRTKEDNDNILKCYNEKKDILIKLSGIPGPIVVIPNKASSNIIKLDSIKSGTVKKAASICIGYTKVSLDQQVCITIQDNQNIHTIYTKGLDKGQSKNFLI